MTILIFLGIGVGIAFLIHNFGSKDKYEVKLEAANKAEMNWAFLSAFIFGITVWLLNTIPEIWKVKCVAPGDLWPNVFIYRLAAGDPAETSAVILHTEGDYGKYNRAHRALYHFLENVLAIVFALPFTF